MNKQKINIPLSVQKRFNKDIRNIEQYEDEDAKLRAKMSLMLMVISVMPDEYFPLLRDINYTIMKEYTNNNNYSAHRRRS